MRSPVFAAILFLIVFGFISCYPIPQDPKTREFVETFPVEWRLGIVQMGPQDLHPSVPDLVKRHAEAYTNCGFWLFVVDLVNDLFF